MTHAFHEIAFTDAVREVQADQGSAQIWERLRGGPVDHDVLGRDEAEFLASRDSFYMASVSETGWPYMQHRGGPAGFVRILGPTQIGWAEFAGNRQFITTGNLRGNGKVSLFFMDYARKARLKILGQARVIAMDAPEFAALPVDGGKGRVQRGILVDVAGFEWNCPQHITQRYTLAEVQGAMAKMGARIAELEAELAAKS